MSKINLKIIISIIILLSGFGIFLKVLPLFAQPDLGMDFVEGLDLPDNDPRDAAVSIIKLLMTFVGIIAVIILIIGGFLLMVSGGDEDRMSRARRMISGGIIGLILILAAFLIVNFVINNVTNALES